MRRNSPCRPRSAYASCERKNPILPSEQPVVVEKSGKASVNQTFYYSKYPQERPKGKTKTQYSKNSDRTFNIAQADLVSYKPSIRVNIQQSPLNIQRPQSIRVGYKENIGIEQYERPTSRPKGRGSPSPILQYENERKYCLPSEIGITSFNVGGANTSTIFEDSCKSYLFNGKFKCLLSKPCEIQSVIGYEYALPYREQKVTSKP